LAIGITILVNTVEPPSATKKSENPWKPYGPDAKIVIASQEVTRTKSNLSILGTIRNDGSDAWQFIRYQVTLRNAEGRLVGFCSDSDTLSIHPGQSRPFQVDCPRNRDAPLPAYDHFTLEIVEASIVLRGT